MEAGPTRVKHSGLRGRGDKDTLVHILTSSFVRSLAGWSAHNAGEVRYVVVQVTQVWSVGHRQTPDTRHTTHVHVALRCGTLLFSPSSRGLQTRPQSQRTGWCKGCGPGSWPICHGSRGFEAKGAEYPYAGRRRDRQLTDLGSIRFCQAPPDTRSGGCQVAGLSLRCVAAKAPHKVLADMVQIPYSQWRALVARITRGSFCCPHPPTL